MYPEPSTRKTWSPFFSGRAAGLASASAEAGFEAAGLALDLAVAGMGGNVVRRARQINRTVETLRSMVPAFAGTTTRAMRDFSIPLPIDAALPQLTAALARSNAAVLVAPPGAGKTTRVPLVLIDEPWTKDRKILVLEPRRLAARAAAARMASTLGEEVGGTVGLRVRFGSKVSKRTRIEVVTEGVFTRLVLDDPSLEGIAAVLFDEFHERSLDADLGLALARDAQSGLREDLKLLVMSATIDGARVAKLLGDAPVVESGGRAFPVETRYLGRDQRAPIEGQVAEAVT